MATKSRPEREFEAELAQRLRERARLLLTGETQVLQTLVDAGNTVLVIEHNLDVIKTADRVLDLGPEGGEGGGTIVAYGTPEAVAQNPNSYTGRYLARILERDSARRHIKGEYPS